MPKKWADVPWRTIIATIGLVMAALLLVYVIQLTSRILTWVAIAGFFAVVLAPLVRRVQDHVGGRRNLATGIVMFATVFVVLGVVALFILPVRTQLLAIITDLPGTVRDAADGKGPIGDLVKRLNLDDYVKDNEAELARAADRLDISTFETARLALGAALAFITITLITFLFLSQSEAMGRAALSVIPGERRASVRRVAVDAAAAVSGYVIGNLLISVIAGVAAFICLVSLGVPSPVVLALFVAFADLIPLVGAILGAGVAVIAAYLHSVTAGVVALVFFIVYQQVENGLIYPWMMSRKVKVNPLVVLLSVLLAAEVFGLVGALLAVPVSGAAQVIITAARVEHHRVQLVLPTSLAEPVDVTSG